MTNQPLTTRLALLCAALPLALSGCASMNMGAASAKTSATGAAGGETSQNANSKLERCSA